jgi:hypothetical protein
MTAYAVNPNTYTYRALSTDIVEGKIDGVFIKGTLVYLEDLKKWMIVNEDLTLSDYSLGKVSSDPDAKTGQIVNIQPQFSSTPGTVLKIDNLPVWAKFVKIYPQSGNVAFAFGEDPAIDAADSGTENVIDADGASIGGIAVAGSWEVRIPNGMTDIRLASDTASAKVWVELSSGQ